MNCHRSDSTFGVPGTLIHSVFPSPDGVPLPQFGQRDTDSRTPFENLWGGWYVTGKSGAARHLGNAVVTDVTRPESMATAETAYLESLAGRIDTRDRQDRSLRQLDLERRLLRYPRSYMIYAAAFDALPAEAKRAIYVRMWRILSGEERSPRYARLSLADRRAIVEILRDTRPDLPDYFRSVQR